MSDVWVDEAMNELSNYPPDFKEAFDEYIAKTDSIFHTMVDSIVQVNLAQANLDSICAERGHICVGSASATLRYFPPRHIDYEDSTVWEDAENPGTYSLGLDPAYQVVSKPQTRHKDTIP